MDVNWREVQQRLAQLGFNPGPIDGLRGPRTDAALVAFKRSIGFRARPYYGPLTHRALAEATQEVGDIPWMDEALRIRGLHEERNTSQLRRWFHSSVSWLDPREVPWCGAFVATCVKRAAPEARLPDNPLGARNWNKFGVQHHPGFGAILVFWRGSRSGWKGHVGFYWGEDETAFHVLGGNQSDAVTVARITKRRLLGARWVPGFDAAPGKPVLLDARGVPLSTNEA